MSFSFSRLCFHFRSLDNKLRGEIRRNYPSLPHEQATLADYIEILAALGDTAISISMTIYTKGSVKNRRANRDVATLASMEPSYLIVQAMSALKVGTRIRTASEAVIFRSSMTTPRRVSHQRTT